MAGQMDFDAESLQKAYGALETIAAVHEKNGDIASAVQCLHAILQSNPPARLEARIRCDIGMLLARYTTDLSEARRHFERLAVLSKSTSGIEEHRFRAAMALCDIYMLQSNTDFAKAVLRGALSECASNPAWTSALHFKLAEVWAACGDHFQALDSLRLAAAAGKLLPNGAPQFSAVVLLSQAQLLLTHPSDGAAAGIVSDGSMLSFEGCLAEVERLFTAHESGDATWVGLRAFGFVLSATRLLEEGNNKEAANAIRSLQQSIKQLGSGKLKETPSIQQTDVLTKWTHPQILLTLTYFLSIIVAEANGDRQRAETYTERALITVSSQIDGILSGVSGNASDLWDVERNADKTAMCAEMLSQLSLHDLRHVRVMCAVRAGVLERQCLRMVQQSRLVEALSACRSARASVSLFPAVVMRQAPMIHLLVGIVLLASGAYTQAIESFRVAIELHNAIRKGVASSSSEGSSSNGDFVFLARLCLATSLNEIVSRALSASGIAGLPKEADAELRSTLSWMSEERSSGRWHSRVIRIAYDLMMADKLLDDRGALPEAKEALTRTLMDTVESHKILSTAALSCLARFFIESDQIANAEEMVGSISSVAAQIAAAGFQLAAATLQGDCNKRTGRTEGESNLIVQWSELSNTIAASAADAMGSAHLAAIKNGASDAIVDADTFSNALCLAP